MAELQEPPLDGTNIVPPLNTARQSSWYCRQVQKYQDGLSSNCMCSYHVSQKSEKNELYEHAAHWCDTKEYTTRV